MLYIHSKFCHVTAVLTLQNEGYIRKQYTANPQEAIEGRILTKLLQEAVLGFLVSLARICL